MSRMACALLMAMVLSACTPPGGGGSSADCAAAVRFEGALYVEGGFSKRAGEALGQGDEASCDDNGRDAQGTYFKDEPPQVSLWSFADFDPEQVVAVRESKRRFRVYFAEGVSQEAKREIESALRSAGR
jgi:hypothetical protein